MSAESKVRIERAGVTDECGLCRWPNHRAAVVRIDLEFSNMTWAAGRFCREHWLLFKAQVAQSRVGLQAEGMWESEVSR